jgi:hypothetical protein
MSQAIAAEPGRSCTAFWVSRRQLLGNYRLAADRRDGSEVIR